MPGLTRVFVADDHPVYRRAVVRAIGRSPLLEVVGEASDGDEALDRLRTLEADVIVLDYEMPGLDGLELLEAFAEERIAGRILMLSGYYDSGLVDDAMKGGASGFLSKGDDEAAICDAVAAVARGETVLGAAVQAAVAEGPRRRRE